jgi:hypothetical protein
VEFEAVIRQPAVVAPVGNDHLDAAAGVFDDRQDAMPRAGQHDRFDEVRAQQCLGLPSQELRRGVGGYSSDHCVHHNG